MERHEHGIGRRRLLGLGGVSGAAILLGTGLYGVGRATDALAVGPYPFQLGVASGDPLPDSVVLWTRLAPEPLAEDGLGGMPQRAVAVRYEVARDERFRDVVRRGQAAATPELAHSVHVDVQGLQPGREYFYRFRAGRELSPVGRTKTAPAPGAATREMTFAFTSCQHFEEGYFSAYRHLLADDPDLVAHCGDYIYESPSGLAVQPRKHVVREPFDLREYRLRYAQYRTDADLAEAHRLLPWIFTYDDHEVDNNWAGDISEHYPTVGKEEFLRRRAAAFQAYYEHLPLRPDRAPHGPDIAIHRRFRYGDLATFHVLDGRQFRDPQLPCTDPMACPDRLAPARTLLGPEQEAWLKSGLRSSATRWDVLVQQVPFTQLDEAAGPGFQYGKDNWNYFPAARQRIVDELVARPDLNAIVIGGEIHRHLAADIKATWDDPAAPPVASEFVATSVASGGNGNAGSTWVTRILAENPHIKYAWEQRGYVRARISQQEWRTDLRVVPVVTTPSGDAVTGASFVVEAGKRGLQVV
ncbi:alkaline phosphatase D family protein [Tenggerimyces flavus]|uniref:Alkaline phosphatase D family protein n=1 Tax=Tenggerimyces flavus TaxID=1708749 RepID=A0ABV7Y6D8_9ACTN|nr:alkaline phosphatase D family protein [Tenggerimyces flavus]MBM7785245.1 alkaline phosphatase D [Tenggerimyces flavus]